MMVRQMMLTSCLAFGLAGASVLSSAEATQANSVAATPAAAYSTGATDIGTLLDNPDTRAVLQKHMAGFADNPQIEMARSMTLKQIQGFAGDAITDEVLAKVDVDLAKLPARK
jgi:hypothetical protein